MRVLVVSPWFPGEDTPGSGSFVRREVASLRELHEVHLVHLDWQRRRPFPRDRVEGYRYTHMPLSRSDPRSYVRARRLVRELSADADIVHTHALTGLLPWLLGRPGRSGAPWVHSEHWSGITAPETLGWAERMTLVALRRALRRPDAVVAESTRLADGIRACGRDDVDIVPCVVPNVRVVEPERPEQLRLVAVGSLIPRKGPLTALAAVKALADDGFDPTLTWVGGGPLRDLVLAEAERLGIGERIRLTGPLPDEGVGQELDAATLFVLPTEGDNFCIVAAEALVHGRPLVSGVKTGAIDYAEPQVSRFVAEPTATAYASAIRDLHAATSGMTAAAIAATVRDRFTPETVSEMLTALYRRVRSTRGAAS